MKQFSVLQRILFSCILILFLLFEIYKMFPREPIIHFPSFFLVVLCFLTSIYVFGRNYIPKDSTSISFIVLEILVLFFSFEHSLFYQFSYFTLYAELCLPLLFFLFSYYFTMQIVNKDVLPVVSFFLICVFSVVYLKYRNDSLDEILHSDSGSYTVLYFLPFALCLKNKYLKVLALFVCFFSVLSSFKRGGVVCLISGLYIYMFFCVIKEKKFMEKMKRLLLTLFPLVVVVLGVYFFDAFFDGYLSYRFSKTELDGGSGRDRIFEEVVKMISNSSWIEFLVGHGWNSVVHDSYFNLSAHNDFLECLYDFGFVTLAAYISLYVCLVKMAIGMLKRNSVYVAPLSVSIVIFFINSTVSHILLYRWFFIIFALFWGYIVACDEIERNVKS